MAPAYTLYYSPGACSLAIHALLYSLDVPFDTVCIDIQAPRRSNDFLKLNPRGQVPVLIANGTVLRESAVIAVYLAEEHDSSFLPKEKMARVAMMEWLSFYTTTLQQAYGAYFLLSKNMKDENARQSACHLAARRIRFLWKEVEQHLANHRFLCGDNVTLPDLFHAVIAAWTGTLGEDIILGSNVIRLNDEIRALPCFRKALQAEGSENVNEDR